MIEVPPPPPTLKTLPPLMWLLTIDPTIDPPVKVPPPTETPLMMTLPIPLIRSSSSVSETTLNGVDDVSASSAIVSPATAPVTISFIGLGLRVGFAQTTKMPANLATALLAISSINATVLNILGSAELARSARAPPRTFGEQTAQIMLAELNETVVAAQLGTYADDIARQLNRTLGIRNQTAIAELAAFGAACPRSGMGSTVMTLQQVFVADILLAYTGVMVTCDSIWYHTTLGSATAGAAALGTKRFEQVVTGAQSTSTMMDALLLLTAYAAGRQTGIIPMPPPARVIFPDA